LSGEAPTPSAASPAPSAADAERAPPDVASAGEGLRAPPGLPRRARWLVAGLAVAALAALFWPRGADDGPTAGGFLVDANGRPTPLAGQLAPVTLLHFWSTWCPPCIEEVPAIDRLARDLSAEGEFRLLMVAVEDDPAQVARFAGAARERVLYDPKWEIAHRYGTRQLPETYLLVKGKVARKFTGATDWDDPQVRALVKGALAGVRAR
jgi:thiol-disulfide isomerase/thioredoxin